MGRMGKQRPKPPKPEPENEMPATAKPPKRVRLSLHVYLPPPLRQAIERAAQANRRPLTAEVEIALEKHLKELGYWPPPPA
jgi:hypothetical protein